MLYSKGIVGKGQKMYDDEYEPDEWEARVERFADPGGRSALHAAGPDNPRIYPCPTCHRANMLTARDVAAGYQCDHCADAAEGLVPEW